MAALSLTKAFDLGRVLLLLIGWDGLRWDGRFCTVRVLLY